MTFSLAPRFTHRFRSPAFWGAVATLAEGIVVLSVIYTGYYYLAYSTVQRAYDVHPEFQVLEHLETICTSLMLLTLIVSIILTLIQRRCSLWQLGPPAIVLIMTLPMLTDNDHLDVISFLHNSLWTVINALHSV